ncbi:MAG: preprotein translocase subunit SecY [Spirochaetes bacterium GWD1_27_9]|nr:MAG: preprotein translocase subunit SecY [Spirochaetes bacterium GWC1_27_15]OHD45401.1 MAG: preprotein translocase subunit SecY [Spirochaetes bacterium GWD1_27_9]
MSNSLINIFKIKELRDKILFTVFILLVYRIGTQIPVPGIDFSALKLFLESQKGNSDPLYEYFNFFAGGAFDNMSIFALGIMPYITTSIIMQLLLLVIPSLKRISEEEGGKRKITQFTRIGAVPVCILQSFLAINFINNLPEDVIVIAPKILFYISTVLVTTTGTLVLMWLGERITAKGIGNGISLIIFAGIVARLPSALKQLFDKVQSGDLDIPVVLFILLMFVFVIALVIFEQQGQRKIPVNYAKRVVGRKVYGAPSTYLPLKINPSGVIPIIFANSLLIFPQTLTGIFKNVEWVGTVSNFLRTNGVPYMIVYSLMIIAFAYFYTQVTLNPIEIAKNIRENGGSIPGVPVNKVEEYLTRVLNRIVLPGSIFLAFIAIIPTIIINLIPDFPASFAYLLGGTSLIIIVGVDLDTMSQIESHLKMHHQDGLIKKGKIRSRNF